MNRSTPVLSPIVKSLALSPSSDHVNVVTPSGSVAV